ncbi:GntR family transcriptional regulator [uncultured Sphaerochaeta sp.]|uniref:GntR family transcriptional regulator n=1 Tax=uncultured Sphaerochaeta sp. TaxID=886478 RepID=UPI002A0A62A7|nr:GntR family transcriptional regulator [uncultured Sphaerochaeta sp.]
MQFNTHSPIYLQIAGYIHDLILNGIWTDGERIPSVRDLAVELEVNPNTIVRTYAVLQEEGTLDNQRGIGYFTAPHAKDLVLKKKREQFIKTELPSLFSSLKVLDIPLEELETYYRTFQKDAQSNENKDETK